MIELTEREREMIAFALKFVSLDADGTAVGLGAKDSGFSIDDEQEFDELAERISPERA